MCSAPNRWPLAIVMPFFGVSGFLVHRPVANYGHAFVSNDTMQLWILLRVTCSIVDYVNMVNIFILFIYYSRIIGK